MNSGRYGLVIFDVDGTLLDTKEGILSSVKYTINHFGLPMISNEKLLEFIGPPIHSPMRSVCRDVSFRKLLRFSAVITLKKIFIKRNRTKEYTMCSKI